MGAHGQVIFKSDQENPILDMLCDVCKQRGKECDSAMTFVESSPKGESQSNSIAKRAAYQSDLDAKLKTTVQIGHPCIAWIVENVADTINKFKNGPRRSKGL